MATLPRLGRHKRWTKPLPDDYPNGRQLKEVGIHYTCTCPRFNHYHVCKHVLAVALHFKQTTVPTRFSCQYVGKRKAPAGASCSRRSRALEIDD